MKCATRVFPYYRLLLLDDGCSLLTAAVASAGDAMVQVVLAVLLCLMCWHRCGDRACWLNECCYVSGWFVCQLDFPTRPRMKALIAFLDNAHSKSLQPSSMTLSRRNAAYNEGVSEPPGNALTEAGKTASTL